MYLYEMKKNALSYLNEIDKRATGQMWAVTMVYFLLAASTILFIFLAVSFWQAVPLAGFSIPPQLSLSTVFIAISCVLTIKLKQYKKEDQHKQYRKIVLSITGSGILFFICQFFGWLNLLKVLSSGSRNMVLVLLVAHALHFVVAAGMAIYFTIKAYQIKSGADLYIWYLNPKRQLTFKLGILYWDFLSYVWLILFVLMQLRMLL